MCLEVIVVGVILLLRIRQEVKHSGGFRVGGEGLRGRETADQWGECCSNPAKRGHGFGLGLGWESASSEKQADAGCVWKVMAKGIC